MIDHRVMGIGLLHSCQTHGAHGSGCMFNGATNGLQKLNNWIDKDVGEDAPFAKTCFLVLSPAYCEKINKTKMYLMKAFVFAFFKGA